ncbi:MAG: dihydropteroate synthase [Planctomycetes bacterium]|nr:dihydropteroate synthase [Planctomycetota bacterium]
MIAIGERINGQFNDVRRAIAEKDGGPIQDLARRQTDAGAAYLDINVGTAAEDPLDAMRWLVETAQAACETPLCLDSQKPEVIRAGLEVCDTSRGVLLNSSPLSKKSDPAVLDTYASMAREAGGSLICLTMDTEGVPQTIERRVEIAAELVTRAMDLGLEPDRLFIDPIILPVNVPGAQGQPGLILQAIEQIALLSDPPPHITMGLSNLSQGAAERSLINRTFLAMAVSHGCDSAIVDVLDDALVDAVAAAEMIMNMQIYSDSFLKAYRGQAGRQR